MARYICPSCGAQFNGRKCKKCYYVHFTEEIAHGLHTHEGEPLVIDAPERRQIPRKKPFGCEKSSRKKPGILNRVLTLVLLVNFLSLGTEWILEGIGQTAQEAVPEPVLSPQAVLLWEGEEIAVWSDWGSAAGDHMSIPVLVQNNSREDVSVVAHSILVGDFQTTHTHLYVDAQKGSWGRGYLYLDEEIQTYAGEGPFEEVCFDLEIYDAESYDTLFEIADLSITLETPLPGSEPPEGIVLADREEISIRYLGHEQYGDQWQVLLMVENRTDRLMDIWSGESRMNGQEADISCWAELPPGTRTVMRGYFYTEKNADAPETIEITLNLSDAETYESLAELEPLTFELN